ncbi:uncharacterized protein [Haliotis cracherodii]|uniref:uncharacterized protein n=1 Tax=Haliotis cracherodii TaxID=6455 RepID=UPI0039EADDE6
MTSLEIRPARDLSRREPPEWGTGKAKEHVDPWIPRTPTWHYSGQPREQFYTLTQLKRSNLRKDDQLIPRPQDSDMGKELINLPFPAEHPYTSHMSQFAVFPKFDSPEDPKRGVAARSQQPINSEMPASAYDVKIKHKTKGYGDRYEIQALPKESEKKALYWRGEDFFDQLVKTHGNRQPYYPTPPKVIAPNLQDRPMDMKVSDRTANTLRNVERSHWTTSHSLDYTGLGPSNPKKLENLDDKRVRFLDTGLEDDKLYPRSSNTFDPPRPMEGRIARMLTPKPANQKMIESGTPVNPNYQRKMTLTEKEEHRLLNGQAYTNMPDNDTFQSDTLWKEMDMSFKPEPALKKLEDLKATQEGQDVPYPPTGAPPDPEESYLKKTKGDRDDEIQQMEAENRWHLLELQKPSNDITLLNVKYQHATDKEKPQTFYGHEGKYNEERAGLYKTSYNPQRLAYSMNNLTESGPEIMNTLHSHVGAERMPTRLSHDNDEALRTSRTLCTAQANLSGDRRSTEEVLQPYQFRKENQKQMIQPNEVTARPLVQEGDFLLKESTMGDSYNVHKFLQENELPRHARNDPQQVMSRENQRLSNVRSRSGTRTSKSVQFSDNVTIRTVVPDQPIRVETAPAGATRPRGRSQMLDSDVTNTTQYVSRHALYSKENENPMDQSQTPRHKVTFRAEFEPLKELTTTKQDISVPDRSFKRRPNASSLSEYKDEFGSLSTNFMPSNLKTTMAFRTSYESQFPTFNLDFKDDSRFSWEPGCGVPRPQTSLLNIQNRFNRSAVRRSFHGDFREEAPDLRKNISSGKKHNFSGFNTQVLHG